MRMLALVKKEHRWTKKVVIAKRKIGKATKISSQPPGGKERNGMEADGRKG